MCGKNVIHLDGRYDVYKSSGIRDTNYDSQANYAMDNRGKQHRVLFDGVQDCAKLFHLPLRVPEAMFDGLDDVDDDVPVNVGTQQLILQQHLNCQSRLQTTLRPME